MFPLILLAVAALVFTRQKKSPANAQPPAPSGGMSYPDREPKPIPAQGTGGGILGGLGPTGNVSVQAECDFDLGIPDGVRAQAVALISQAETAGAAGAGPLASSLDTLAVGLEMTGLGKTAACLRAAALKLRKKYPAKMQESSELLMSPIQAGYEQASPMLVNVLPKPKA
jgi:hypothetical protein